MSLGSYSYGSAPYGGTSALGQIVFETPIQQINSTLYIPVWVAKHSLPATFALSLTIETPTVNISNQVSLQSLSLSLGGPGYLIDLLPALFSTSLTLESSVHEVRVSVSLFTLGLTFSTEETEVAKGPALFNLTLTGLDVHIPGISITHRAHYNELKLKSPRSPYWTDLTPRIVRYIKDPIVSGGCPQCGTLLYNQGHAIHSEAVTYGRNFENPEEDVFVRCVRCHFPVKIVRHVHHPEESRAGWGMRYTEVEAGS